jgi:diacylglycerol kinase family enzyme
MQQLEQPGPNQAVRHMPDVNAAAGRDLCVIFNPGAGAKDGAQTRASLEEWLGDHPGRSNLKQIGEGGDIVEETRRAMDEGYGTIVAAGGDGTICAVASQLKGTDHVMGVLPLGTFNYFARGLGIPEDPDEAMAVIRGGQTAPVSVGEVNGRTFLNNASLGAYPAILDQREGVYRRWGRSRIAAYWSVIVALVNFTNPLTMRIVVDGEVRRMRSPLAFVANSAYQLEQFELEGADHVRNGRFALYVAADHGRLGLVRHALMLANRSMQVGRDVELIGGRDIVIETRRSKNLIARDGEKEVMTAPLHFQLRRDALTVIVPASDGGA